METAHANSLWLGSLSHVGPSKGLSGSGARSIGVRSVPSQEPSGLGVEPHSEASSLPWLARGHQGEKTGKFPQ